MPCLLQAFENEAVQGLPVKWYLHQQISECVVQDIHDICSNLNEKKTPVNTESPQVNYSSAYNICGD